MEQAVNLQNTSQAGYTAGASKWKKRIGYGVGISDAILYSAPWRPIS